MILRRQYYYVLHMRRGIESVLVIDNPGGFNLQSIGAIIHPRPADASYHINLPGGFDGKLPFAMLQGSLVPFPIVPALHLFKDAQISVTLEVPLKGWWARLVAFFRPYRAEMIFAGENLYEVEDGVPVELEWDNDE